MATKEKTQYKYSVRKVLIVRFSSLGDILQCWVAAQHFKLQGYQVHWLTREDFIEVVKLNPYVDESIEFKRSWGIFGLIRMAFHLQKNSYDLVYDAHNNLRSHILSMLLLPLLLLRSGFQTKFIRRKKFRLRRYFLFNWHWDLFKKKIIGQNTYLEPLGATNLEFQWPNNSIKENYVALVPGAAWPLKQWPLDSWLNLINQFPQQDFVVLGGKSDQICFEIGKQSNSPRIRNLAGQLSYVESLKKVAASLAVVSNDTGLLHGADLMKVPTLALIGPSAFGYPASKSSQVAEVHLWCKPCSKDGRGRCKNKVFMKCMHDIHPQDIGNRLRQILEKMGNKTAGDLIT